MIPYFHNFMHDQTTFWGTLLFLFILACVVLIPVDGFDDDEDL